MTKVILLFIGLLGWQQDVRYEIKVSLDVDSSLIRGTETLIYKNNSPDTLSYVWFHLYPNAYRKGSIYARETANNGNFALVRADESDLGWIETSNLTSNGTPCMTKVIDTEMKVLLRDPILPGESNVFKMDFRVKIPAFFSRMGHRDEHFVISQWYPKIVVYDNNPPVSPPLGMSETEYRGKSGWWHPDGYHATGEFYGEYGTYDVWITLPERFVVGATGEIVGEDHYGSLKTLHYHAEKVHDFVWVADPNFVVWDTTYEQTHIRILVVNNPTHKKLWRIIPSEVPKILQKFSEWFYPYPYSTLTVVDGKVGVSSGMEYPTVVLVSVTPFLSGLGKITTNFFVDIVAHEIAHQWFYGILGNNEMEEAWLDEGFATFAEMRYMRWRVKQDNKLTDEFVKLLGNVPLETIEDVTLYWLVNSPWDEPLIGKKAYQMPSYWINVYAKGAKLLWLIYETVGAERFDSLMHRFFQKYAFHHITTDDFLGWVKTQTDIPVQAFTQWLKDNPEADLKIKKYKVIHITNGTKVNLEIERNGLLHTPVRVAFVLNSGDTLIKTISPGINTLTSIFSDVPTRVILDPGNTIPESDEWNNALPREIEIGSVFRVPPFHLNSLWAIWTPILTWDTPTGWVPGIGIFGTQAFLRHTFSASLGYSVKTKKPLASITISEPLTHNLSRFSISGNLIPGGGDIQFQIKRMFMSRMTSPRRQILTLAFLHEDIRNLGYYNRQIYESGLHGCLSGNYSFTIHRAFWDAEFTTEVKTGIVGFRYTKGWLCGNLTLGYPFRFSIWAYAGEINGTPPQQEEFYLQGEVREPPGYSIFIPGTGRFSPVGQNMAIGYGMAGYAGSGLRGLSKFVAGIGIKYKWVELYWQTGGVWEGLKEASLKNLLYEAGLTVGERFGKIILPFWTKKKGFGFRFVIWVPSSIPSINLSI